jgi:hypothetical protein
MHDVARVAAVLGVVGGEALHARRLLAGHLCAEELLVDVGEKLAGVGAGQHHGAGRHRRGRGPHADGLAAAVGVGFLAREAVELGALRIQRAEQVVERPVLQHQHDHVLDCVQPWHGGSLVFCDDRQP